MSSLLENLTPKQIEAVTKLEGSLLVNAPVGTGKTETIARRVAYAIEKGVSASSILCLTFTNKASREMKARIEKLLAQSENMPIADDLTICTFHRLCLQILQCEADAAGLLQDFSVYDENDSKAIIKALIQKYGIKASAEVTKKLVDVYFNFISKHKLAPKQTKLPPEAKALFNDCLNDHWIKERELDFNQTFFYNEIFEDYHLSLIRSNALDFNDLIVKVIELFIENQEVLARWQSTYNWIQVDEMQDTSVPEYWILKLLSEKHKNLSFFGDTNQTIFEWRDSNPTKILPKFLEDFNPVLQIQLEQNHRTTANLLKASLSVLNKTVSSFLHEPDHEHSTIGGEKVRLYQANSIADEAQWIAGEIKYLCTEKKYKFEDFAIIARRHALLEKIGEHLGASDVPFYLVEDSKFFKLSEIKDVLGYLRLLVNPHDYQALHRILKADFWVGSESMLYELDQKARSFGLRLNDFINPASQHGDIFKDLIEKYYQNELVALDCESTGKNPFQDQVIEVAAVKFGYGGVVAKYEALIKPHGHVGDSEKIHKISDEILSERGREPKEVLSELLDFVGNRPLVGHNIGFDVELLNNNLRQNDFNDVEFVFYDTCDISKRFFNFPNYQLNTICEKLSLKKPTHRAMEDVLAVVGLVEVLIPKLEEGSKNRAEMLSESLQHFDTLNRYFEKWRKRINDDQPSVTLSRILEDRAIEDKWQQNEKLKQKLKYLGKLKLFFEKFGIMKNPKESLAYILSLTGLNSDVSFENQKVPLITAHQSKGMEFNVVFIAGANEGEFPSSRVRNKKGDEQERKLLYVAMTRAKQRLYISFFIFDDRGFRKTRSPFIDDIPPDLMIQALASR